MKQFLLWNICMVIIVLFSGANALASQSYCCSLVNNMHCNICNNPENYPPMTPAERFHHCDNCDILNQMYVDELCDLDDPCTGAM